MRKRTAFFGIPGLGTPASSSCHTIRPRIEALLTGEFAGSGSAAMFIEYNRVTVEMVLQFAASINAEQMMMEGHSFGGAAIIWLNNQLTIMKKLICTLAIVHDPAPNGPLFGQYFNWAEAKTNNDIRWAAPASMQNGLCFYQDNQVYVPEMAGICGVPFKPEQPRILNVDCTPWGLRHNDVPEDPMVHAIVKERVMLFL